MSKKKNGKVSYHIRTEFSGIYIGETTKGEPYFYGLWNREEIKNSVLVSELIRGKTYYLKDLYLKPGMSELLKISSVCFKALRNLVEKDCPKR